jgi:cell division protein FtsB
MLGVAYGNIVGVLIEAIKEQQQQIENQKQQNDALSARIEQLENK